MEGPQGHLRCNTGTFGKRTIKLVNQRRLSSSLCISVMRNDSRRIAPRMIEKYPLHVENI